MKLAELRVGMKFRCTGKTNNRYSFYRYAIGTEITVAKITDETSIHFTASKKTFFTPCSDMAGEYWGSFPIGIEYMQDLITREDIILPEIVCIQDNHHGEILI